MHLRLIGMHCTVWCAYPARTCVLLFRLPGSVSLTSPPLHITTLCLSLFQSLFSLSQTAPYWDTTHVLGAVNHRFAATTRAGGGGERQRQSFIWNMGGAQMHLIKFLLGWPVYGF